MMTETVFGGSNGAASVPDRKSPTVCTSARTSSSSMYAHTVTGVIRISQRDPRHSGADQ